MKKIQIFLMALSILFFTACNDKAEKSSMYPEFKRAYPHNVPRERIYELAAKYNLADPEVIKSMRSDRKDRSSYPSIRFLDSAVITCCSEEMIERTFKSDRKELDDLNKFLNKIWQIHRDLANAKNVREALIYHYIKNSPGYAEREFGSEAKFYKYLDSIYVLKNINFYVVNADSSLAIIPQEFETGHFPGRLIPY